MALPDLREMGSRTPMGFPPCVCVTLFFFLQGKRAERERREEEREGRNIGELLLFGMPSSLQRDIVLLEDLPSNTPDSGELSYYPSACLR